MNQEGYCTRTVIARTTIVCSASIYDALKLQLLCFMHSSMTLLSCVTFAGEVLFFRNLPTSIKPDATLGERIDLRMSCEPDVPHTQDEKADNTLLFSSLTKQVLNSPNKSTMIADLIKNYAQEKDRKCR